jgi:hypothetical protein
MGGPRDILNNGFRIAGRTVALAYVPEDLPSTENDGQPIVVTLESHLTIVPPFFLCIAEIVGGTNALADLHAYAYYANTTQLTNKWQRIRSAIANGDTLTYLPIPTVGASRIAVVVRSLSSGATSVRLELFAVSDEALDLAHLTEGEFSPIPDSGGKLSLTTAIAVRIGPLTLDRTIHFFSDRVFRARRGNSSVVATTSDFPCQAGAVYYFIPRRTSSSYLSFLADSDDCTLWYGQAL